MLEAGRVYGDKIVGYRMEALESVDIDTELDLQWAEFIVARRSPGRQQK